MTTIDDALIPAKELASKIAIKGEIGQALECALEEVLKQQHGHVDNDDTMLLLTPTATQCILESLGRAVATTDWGKVKAARLNGRLDHYNRFHGQWRIVMDGGAKLEEARCQPPPLMSGKKRKLPLRDDDHGNVIERKESVKIKDPIQMLLYNDL